VHTVRAFDRLGQHDFSSGSGLRPAARLGVSFSIIPMSAFSLTSTIAIITVDGAAGAKGGAGKGGAGKGGADKEKEKMDMKERTKLKRQRDQSASFLGGQWKSEEEMHLRDHFDS
jgi:hypothetical protein